MTDLGQELLLLVLVSVADNLMTSPVKGGLNANSGASAAPG